MIEEIPAVAAPASTEAVQPKLPLAILIVEDDPDDRDNIQHCIASGMRLPHHVVPATCLGEAFALLEDQHFDVVLIDLDLPDSNGAESVRRMRERKRDAAIIVISGSCGEEIAESCFEAGAQDFIDKRDLTEILLARVVGYALYRIRDRQLQELTQSLEQYRSLTSAGSTTPQAGRMTGGGPLSERMPQLFEQAIEAYRDITKAYMRYLAILKDKPAREMEQLITRLGDQGGGPRDLMDIHVRVVDEALRRADGELSRTMTSESRLMALEMMGMLVNYYRVGTRRR